MIRLKSLLLEFDLNAPGELEKAKEYRKRITSPRI
jgi:hypothetical protein